MNVKILFFLLFPLLGISQVQIGQDMNGDTASEAFGKALSLSADGKMVAVSANRKTGSNPNNLPLTYVRVFRNVNGVWNQIGNDIDSEHFGPISLSSDGERSVLAIGMQHSPVNGFSSGQVKIYELNTSNFWTQKGQDINGLAAGDWHGYSVSLSADGNTIAIGAWLSYNGTGSVRVFNYNAGVWTQIGQDIIGKGINDRNGASVSLSPEGNIVAIGADASSFGNSDPGFVRVYKYELGNWVQVGQDITGKHTHERFGEDVSISEDGNTVVGVTGNSTLNAGVAGLARVYGFNSGSWQQIGQDIPITSELGPIRASISGNGRIVAVGAAHHSQTKGVVKIFSNQSGNWIQAGVDIDGNQRDDKKGFSVSLSSDGNTVATGAIGNRTNGMSSGVARVYDLSSVSSDEFVLENLNIYPNPATDVLNISLENNLVLEKVTLYNNLGQIVKTDHQSTIDVSALAKGLYFIEIETNQGKAFKKVIIK